MSDDDEPWYLTKWTNEPVVVVHPLWGPFGERMREFSKRAKDARERRDRSSHHSGRRNR